MDELKIEREHYEEIKERHETEIKELRDKLNGLPERLGNVEDKIARLTDEISDFIKELRKGYVSKEVCEMCREGIEKDLKIQEHTNKIVSRVIWWIATSAVAVIVIVLLKNAGLM